MALPTLTTQMQSPHAHLTISTVTLIAFLRYLPTGKTAVLLMPAIGGLERKVTEISSISGRPAWSTDGSWLALSERDSETSRCLCYPSRPVKSGD